MFWFFTLGRMALTKSLNNGGHGHIHELLGGAWSSEWKGLDERTESTIFPFLHVIVVRFCSFLYYNERMRLPNLDGS